MVRRTGRLGAIRRVGRHSLRTIGRLAAAADRPHLPTSAMMREITGEPPTMWGTSIIGFGTYHYRYASGHEGDAPLARFSPRRQHLAIYLVGEFGDRYQSVLARLGPHKTGKGCLYLKRLDDVDHDALRELVDRSARVHKGIDRAPT
jgi:hypothetical protein